MSCPPGTISCIAAVLPDVLALSMLGALLFPGFILSIPWVPNTPGKEPEPWYRRMFFTGRVTLGSAIVHFFLLAILITVYELISATILGLCFT